MSIGLQSNKVRKYSFGVSQTNVYSSIQTLTSLDLSENEIGDEGARHLSVALQSNKVRKVFFWCFSN